MKRVLSAEAALAVASVLFSVVLFLLEGALVLSRSQGYADARRDWYRRLFVWSDTHLNETGNRMIADELMRVLLGPSGPGPR